MKKLTLLLLTIFTISCQKDDILRLEQYGYVKLESGIFNSITSKYETVNCSNEAPTMIRYILIDKDGFSRFEQSPITITDNQIFVNNEIRLPIGNYILEDVALLSETGVVTHRIPNTMTTSFDFSSFVDRPTPFDIEILPNEETEINAELLCYTSDILDLNGGLSRTGEIINMATLYFELPAGGCMTRVVIIADGKTIIDIDISGAGIRGTPILRDFDLMEVKAYNGNQLLSSVEITEYNPDNKLTYADVVQFGNVCN